MYGCRLCLDPYAPGPILPLEDPDLQEQLETVFNFDIDTDTQPTPSGICQLCYAIVSDFYRFSKKVRQNQGRIDQALEMYIKLETAEFEEALADDDDDDDGDLADESEDLKENFKEELSEEGDDVYESPPTEDAESYNEGPSAKRKRTQSGQTNKPEKENLNETIKEEPSEEELSEEEQSEEDSDDSSDDDESYEPERVADFKKIDAFYKMRCDDCGVVTEDFSSLNSHHQEIHNRKGFIVCCRRKLSERNRMLEHMLEHENPEAFRCNICKKNYAGSNGLQAHQLKMHSGIDRRMICDICGKEFLDKVAFDRHIKEHAGIEVVKKFQCHICQRWLSGERRLKIHLQNTHYDQQTYTCNICNKQCPSKLALQGHLKTVHVAEKYECEFCGAKFKQRQNLKEHRTIHTGEVLYTCEYCDKSTNSHANYYSHIKKVHPKEWALKKQSKTPKATEGSET